MDAFEYASPTTLKEAIALLSPSWGKTELLAGGTDLLSLMKDYVVSPQRVVNLKGIRELHGIESTPGGVRIGALATLQELLDNKTIHQDFRALAEAAEGVASPQMRNMGTAGGDLCQHPRCWYFRGGYGLLAQDETGRELVPNGDNRYHAIFGFGPAYFVSASSLAPPLIALGAKVRLAGPKGPRELALADFFVAPKGKEDRERAIAPNEILTEVLIPSGSRGLRSATYEVRQRELMDWPLATASVALKLDGGRISSARIVMGHVAPTPWPAGDAEKWLVGKSLNEETAAQAAEAAVRDAKPLSRNGYKVQLARVSVKRALLACTETRAAAAGAA